MKLGNWSSIPHSPPLFCDFLFPAFILHTWLWWTKQEEKDLGVEIALFNTSEAFWSKFFIQSDLLRGCIHFACTVLVVWSLKFAELNLQALFWMIRMSRLDKVIDTVLPPSTFSIENPQLSPQGHLCLCYSCLCLPSYTSGSFHWEKDARYGATLQIPPGCGICDKQPRGMAATLSLFTPGPWRSSSSPLNTVPKLPKQPPICVLISAV